MGETAAEPKAKRRWYQFHLWHLFVLILIVSVGCSTVIPHGLFGIVLLLPHVFAIACVVLPAIRARWIVALLIASAYVTVWFATWLFGIAQVRDKTISLLVGRIGHGRDPAEWTQLDYEPRSGEFRDDIEPPWYFVGNESSPCPFVVALDVASMGKVFGGGERAYVFWFFGHTWYMKSTPRWWSEEF